MMNENMTTNLYITTQLVKATHWPSGETVHVEFDNLPPMLVPTDLFEREFFSIERTEVGFGLALEGMKAGLKFRRLGWADKTAWIELSNGNLRMAWPNLTQGYVTLTSQCLVANDWVRVP